MTNVWRWLAALLASGLSDGARRELDAQIIRRDS